ncbi:hypothetical protein BGX30_008105 [Mortierella sp. GBA39]|nr:hypothetical protein BGX30_008105 [Mortierella sp. GBA39]
MGDCQPGFGSSTENGDKPSYQDDNNAGGNSFIAAGATLMIDPRASRQYNGPVSDDIYTRHTHISTIFTNNSNKESTYSIPSTTDLDDDDESIYDPEFGIGGNGRRRFQNRSCSAVGGCGSGFSSTASSARSSMTISSSAARPLSKVEGMVPSPAVISTATAACAARWRESDALAAATADPSGSFLPGYKTTLHALHNPGSSRNSSSRGSPAGARGSLDRKSFGDSRRNNSLSSGLLLLATGRRSLGQMVSDNSGNSNSAKTVKESSLEVVEPVGSRSDKILSYSQYLAQTQAAAAPRQKSTTKAASSTVSDASDAKV